MGAALLHPHLVRQTRNQMLLEVGMVFSKHSQISCSKCNNLGGLMITEKILNEQRNSLRVWRLYP
jgi:hypothetical protein